MDFPRPKAPLAFFDMTGKASFPFLQRCGSPAIAHRRDVARRCRPPEPTRRASWRRASWRGSRRHASSRRGFAIAIRAILDPRLTVLRASFEVPICMGQMMGGSRRITMEMFFFFLTRSGDVLLAAVDGFDSR